jgi:hypothetical protein
MHHFRQRPILQEQRIDRTGTENRDKTDFPASLFAQFESDRETLEVFTKESDQYSLLSNKGVVSQSNS